MILLAAALAVSAPSFDCARAHTEVEKMICDNERLARSDQAVAMAYRASSKSTKAAQVARDQRDWVAWRNECANVDCLVSRYEDRLGTLLDASNLGLKYIGPIGYLRMIDLGDDWKAFWVVGHYQRPPPLSSTDAWASGVFKLADGRGERQPGPNFDSGWRLTKLRGGGWRVECLPDITSCGGLNATIDGDYR